MYLDLEHSFLFLSLLPIGFGPSRQHNDNTIIRAILAVSLETKKEENEKK